MLRVMSAAEDARGWVKEEVEEEDRYTMSKHSEKKEEEEEGEVGKSGVMLGRSRSTKYEERGREQGSSIHNFCYRFVGGEGEERKT